MKKRILITGESGFTGKHLASFLAHNHDCEVFGLVDRVSNPQQKVDLLDFKALSELIKCEQPTHVVHLAAISYLSEEKISETYNVNVVGTSNLLSLLSQYAKGIEKIIVASSASVYGYSNSRVALKETAALGPCNHYGMSKRCMELMIDLFKQKLPIDIVRPFNYTGVGQSDKFIVPKIVNAYKNKAAQLSLGNVNVERDFSDVRSVIYSLSKLLFNNTSGGVYNISSGKAITLLDIIRLCERLSEHSLNLTTNSELFRSNELEFLAGDSEKLTSVIGNFQLHSFEQTINWMLTN